MLLSNDRTKVKAEHKGTLKGICSEVNTLTGLEMGTQLKWATRHDFKGCPFRVVSVITGSYDEFTSFIRYSQILNSSYALNSNFQTTFYMGLHCGKEGSQKKKKKKKKQSKTKQKKKKKRNPSKQNSRVLLKTIPNENEMKNKYKTKLKNTYHLTPTVFWLTLFT